MKDTLKRWWSVITDPSVWIVPGEYSSYWDSELNALLDRVESGERSFEHAGHLSDVLLGLAGYQLDRENFSPYWESDIFRASRTTIQRARRVYLNHPPIFR
jgi:hypothetical protein